MIKGQGITFPFHVRVLCWGAPIVIKIFWIGLRPLQEDFISAGQQIFFVYMACMLKYSPQGYCLKVCIACLLQMLSELLHSWRRVMCQFTLWEASGYVLKELVSRQDVQQVSCKPDFNGLVALFVCYILSGRHIKTFKKLYENLPQAGSASLQESPYFCDAPALPALSSA